MSHFIKLTSMIINKNLITSVYMKQNKYHIFTVENNISGIVLFGSGMVDSRPEEIVICEEKSPEDYKIFSKWIDTI